MLLKLVRIGQRRSRCVDLAPTFLRCLHLALPRLGPRSRRPAYRNGQPGSKQDEATGLCGKQPPYWLDPLEERWDG